jgi:metallophosphoesterase superfamily enzyme
VIPLSLRLGGQTLDLLPERAAFWREGSALLVADCHFGKAASLRRHGLAVPEGGTADDLIRLDTLLARTQAQSLVVVGDFFHSPSGYGAEVIDALVAWRARHDALRLTLVPGNHDRSLHRLPAALRLDIVRDPHVEAGLGFVHDPGHVPSPHPAGGRGPMRRSGESDAPCGHICGHLHPAIRLGDRRVRGLTAPCFWVRHGSVLVLPSFGAFTGSVAISPDAGDRVFAVAGGRVVEVPGALLAGSSPINTPAPAGNPR